MRPIAAFFAEFSPSPEFTYDPSQAPTREFGRLARAKQWSNTTRDSHKEELNRAMIDQFNEIYGTRDDITAWQALYARLGLENMPETLAECRKVVLSTHVNLVDLTEAVDPEDTVTIFPTVKALRAYTLSEDKIFPRKKVPKGSVLGRLLRQILNGRRRPGVAIVKKDS